MDSKYKDVDIFSRFNAITKDPTYNVSKSTMTDLTQKDAMDIALRIIDKLLPVSDEVRQALTEYVQNYIKSKVRSGRSAGTVLDYCRTVFEYVWWFIEVYHKEDIQKMEVDHWGDPYTNLDSVYLFMDAKFGDKARKNENRAHPHLKRFTEYLSKNGYLHGDTLYFLPTAISNEDVESQPAFQLNELRDLRDHVFAGKDYENILFSKFLLQTGARSGQAYYLCCDDILFDQVDKTSDALGREFVPVKLKRSVNAYHTAAGITTAQKLVPQTVYISKSLAEELKSLCEKLKETPFSELKNRPYETDDGRRYPFANWKKVTSYKSWMTEQVKRMKSEGSINQMANPTRAYSFGIYRHTWASIVYAATNQIGMWLDYGGWVQVKTTYRHYRTAYSERDALKAVEEFGIYIPRIYAENLANRMESMGLYPDSLTKVVEKNVEAVEKLQVDIEKNHRETFQLGQKMNEIGNEIETRIRSLLEENRIIAS